MRFVLAALVLTTALPAAEARQTSPVPELFVADIQGGQVTLSWQTPSDASAPPELYVIVGGVAPGQTLASVPVAGTETSVTVALAPGTYYARLYEVREGVARGPSNEVLIGMSTDVPPSAPDASALALGHDVSLSWRPSPAGGVATGTVLEVSGPVSGALPLGPSGSLTLGGVPAGTYTLTFRSLNAAGASVAAAPVRLTVPGALVEPLVAPPLPRTAAALPVRYENYLTPRLSELLQREQILAQVSGAANEFEAILRLRDWVSRQWDVGFPDPYPPWDALLVLDWIRAGITGGFCAQYSQVFLQSLAALGIPARYVELGPIDNPYAHYTTEVWSNDFDKWVVVDAYFNTYYARDGVPLSALELRDHLIEGTTGLVTVEHGTLRPGQPSPFGFPNRGIEVYYYLRYHQKANHLSAPAEHPFNRADDMVEFLDGRTVPWEHSTVPSPYPHERLTVAETSDRSFVGWGPNRLWLSPRHTGPMQVTLDLQTTMFLPHYVEYRVVDVDGVAGTWMPAASTSLVWNVSARDRVFEARAVNRLGRRGPVSSVQFVDP